MSREPETNLSKLADNVTLTLISRLAMVGLVPVSGFAAYLAVQWMTDQFGSIGDALRGINTRIEIIEKRNTLLERQVQDHESRMVFGKAARENFQIDALRQFEKIGTRLEGVSDQLTELKVSIGELSTTINERVPGRQTSIESLGK